MTGQPTPPIESVTGGSEGTQAHYGEMVGLAQRFESVAGDLMSRSTLGAKVLANGDLLESAVLAPVTFAEAEAAVMMATTGPSGLTVQAAVLEVSAITMRTMVSAYVGVDSLQHAAFEAFDYGTGFALGASPGLAVPFALLAYAQMTPAQRADLPGTVQAWAENNPTVVQHLINGSGGLLDGLQATSSVMLTPLIGPLGGRALWGSLGIDAFNPSTGSAAKDLAGLYRDGDPALSAFTPDDSFNARSAPKNVEDLMATLNETNDDADGTVRIQTVEVGGEKRYIAYIPGTDDMATLPGGSDETIRDMGANLKLMGGDNTAYGRGVIEAVNRATAGDPDPRVMFVGHSQGGMTAAQIAFIMNGTDPSQRFTVDDVVTAGAPTAQIQHIPHHVNVLSLENSGDVIPLTDGEPNPDAINRTTVRFDAPTGTVAGNHSIDQYEAGARAVDQAAGGDTSGSLNDAVRSLGGYLQGGDASSQSVVITRK